MHLVEDDSMLSDDSEVRETQPMAGRASFPLEMSTQPALIVFSSLFPSGAQPNAGLFVRERMLQVAGKIPLAVVTPTPWFPFRSLLNRWRPRHEIQRGHSMSDIHVLFGPRCPRTPARFVR